MVSRVGEWTFNNTLFAPPANGQLRLNTATQQDATKIWIHKSTATMVDATNYLSSVMVGQEIYFQDKSDFTKWQTYKVTDPPISLTNHIEYPVVWMRGGNPVPEQRIFLAIDEIATAEILASPYVFPSTTAFGIALGLTIRQHYAGMAMQGFIAGRGPAANLVGNLATFAYQVADSMLAYEAAEKEGKAPPMAGAPRKRA